MNRRDFIRIAALTGLGLGIEQPAGAGPACDADAALMPRLSARREHAGLSTDKMRNFERPHPGDMFVDAGEFPLLQSCAERLGRLELVLGMVFSIC